MSLDKAGSGSVEARVFNAVVDALGDGTIQITADEIDSQAAQDGEVLTADGAGNATWEPGGGGSQTLTVPLTSANILALDTTGFEFGPTPDAGSMVVPIWAVIAFSPGATPYSVGGPMIITTALAFADAPGSAAWGEFGATPAETESFVSLMQPIDSITDGAAALVDGQRLALFEAGGAVTDGDGTAVLTVGYVIADAPTDPGP